MRHLILYFIFSCIVPGLAYAQEFGLNYRLGYGNYLMNNLNSLQEETIKSAFVEAKATDSYPSFYNHQFQGLIKFEEVWLGASLLRMSTGSRISYKDYSGQLQIDTKVVADGLGVFVARPLSVHKHFQIVLGGQAFATFSNLDIEGIMIIDDQKETQVLDVYSTGFMLEPLARFSAKIGFFDIGVEGSYRMNLANEDFHIKGEKDRTLIDTRGNGLKPDWSGFNIGLVCGLSF